jgi:hypothetical protein
VESHQVILEASQELVGILANNATPDPIGVTHERWLFGRWVTSRRGITRAAAANGEDSPMSMVRLQLSRWARTRETWTADHEPPRGAGIERAFSVSVMPFRVVVPPDRMDSMTGKTST